MGWRHYKTRLHREVEHALNPILYESTEKTFNTLGIGTLADCLRCEVTEERNGLYELEADYPIKGIHYADITTDRIILAKANDNHQTQPFRIYKISKPIGGVVTVYAAHISYDTADIPVSPFSATNAASAVAGFKTNSDVTNPFTFTTDKSTQATFSRAVPFGFKEYLWGIQGSLLDVYGGGDFEFDRWVIYFRNRRGADNGVTIEYGKNLTDARQDENIASLITGVRPYWYSEEDGLVQLPEKVILLNHSLSHDRVEVLDLTGEFEAMPTVAQLRAAAQSYLTTTDKTTPTVSVSVSFVPLWQTENYKSHPLYAQIAGLERVALCDTVTVRYPDLGIDATARVVKTVYDSLRERFNSVDIGEPRTGVSGITSETQKEVSQAVSESFMQQAILAATNAITGATGGYVVLDPPKNPQQIFIMDTDNKATASRVWRWNLNGLGYSSTGVNGPFRLAMTTNPGAIVADFITAGTLNANLVNVTNLNASNINTGTLSANFIKAGVMTSENSVTDFNLNNGELRFTLDSSSYITLSQNGLRIFRDGVLRGEINIWLSGDGNYYGDCKIQNVGILNNAGAVVSRFYCNTAQDGADLTGVNTIGARTINVTDLFAGRIQGRNPYWRTINIGGDSFTLLAAP